jgi:cyclopropane fatty-acyl-phospholipid synthase-like methyltransferase
MLCVGAGRAEGVIHRPVWIDGTRDRREALRTAERLIGAALGLNAATADRGPARLLDLGCGAGSSAIWLAQRSTATVTGITLSALQARAAARRALECGLQERCRFHTGDFLAAATLAPEGLPFHGAYAIEAFSHAASPRRFFRAAARCLSAGGRLALCDDFLAPPPEPAGPSAIRARCLDRLRRGWQLGSLITLRQCVRHAGAAGFVLRSQRDLTPSLRLERPWRWLPQLALGLATSRTPWGSSRLGGAALQQALGAGWVRYLFLVFEKR